MKWFTHLATILLGTVALAACGSRSDDAAASDQAADGQGAPTAAPDTANPFADAEAKMNQAMMAATGSDVFQNWALKMIAHHQGAIDMSEAVLRQNPTPDVAMMARETIEKQKKDIDDIRKLVKDGPPDQNSAALFQPPMMDMKQKMEAATGKDASELYMRKMLEHHRGAVAMSAVALENGVGGTMRRQVQKTSDDNAKDAKMTEAMLNGQPMQQAMAGSGAKSAAEAKKMPAPADKARAADPATSSQDMSNMSNMSNMSGSNSGR